MINKKKNAATKCWCTNVHIPAMDSALKHYIIIHFIQNFNRTKRTLFFQDWSGNQIYLNFSSLIFADSNQPKRMADDKKDARTIEK